MAEFTDALTDKHIEVMAGQPVFFLATAAAEGRIVRPTDRYIAGEGAA